MHPVIKIRSYIALLEGTKFTAIKNTNRALYFHRWKGEHLLKKILRALILLQMTSTSAGVYIEPVRFPLRNKKEELQRGGPRGADVHGSAFTVLHPHRYRAPQAGVLNFF